MVVSKAIPKKNDGSEVFHCLADAHDFIALMKPRVMSLVVFTALSGIIIADGFIHPFLALVALVATAAGAGGAAAFNMWYDRDIDALMTRTRDRPIVRGVLSPESALGFSITLSVGAVTMMALALNSVAAIVLAVSILYYCLLYTVWLKRLTPQNIVIGGAAGAFPPLIGYAAVVPYDFNLYPFILFLIIFLWTPPHFWALALLRRDDYARANVPMLPVLKGTQATIRSMLVYMVLLGGASLLPVFLGFAGMLYGGVACLLGLWFLSTIIRLYRDTSAQNMKSCFRCSIFYLFGLFTAIMLDGMGIF